MNIILSVLAPSEIIRIIIQIITCFLNIKNVQIIKNNAQNISGVVLLHAINIGEEKVSRYKAKKSMGYFSNSFLNIKNKREQNIKYENIEIAIIESIIESHNL
jgi:hypothetical protein